VVKGECLYNNINEDVNLFKVGVNDMPFRAKPHTKMAHGEALWQCGKVLCRQVGVQLPNPSNGFRLESCKHGSRGFLNGISNKLCVYRIPGGFGEKVFA
jgi:hypothetical protein